MKTPYATIARLYLIAALVTIAHADGLSPNRFLGPHPLLPPPNSTPSVDKSPTVLGWPAGLTPKAPAGFKVELYASNLPNPRKMYVLPNGDVLVSEASGRQRSANQIELFRGVKRDGASQLRNVFLRHLNQPFGMLLLGDWLYVADTDGLLRFPYATGQTRISTPGEKILSFNSFGYRGHWTRNLVASPKGDRIYIAVGSSSNAAEFGMAGEEKRANILEIDPSGKNERVFAYGLRNPVGIAFYPKTDALWAVVNERDGMGDDLPPDYLTHVQDGGFYGWPYSYWGGHEDPRLQGKSPDLVKKAITPDFALGDHVAPLSLNFYAGKMFPKKYRGGAFIGEHGSWNSSVMRGYQVYFIPFKHGKPDGLGEPFLTGFVADAEKHQAYGRPVDVATLQDGSILVTDDAGWRIWRISRD